MVWIWVTDFVEGGLCEQEISMMQCLSFRVRIGGQNGDQYAGIMTASPRPYQRTSEAQRCPTQLQLPNTAKDRVVNTEDMRLAFELMYCDTNGPTYAPTVLSLAPLAASVFASALGALRIVRCTVLLHRAAHSLSVRYICVLFRFIQYVSLRVVILSTLTQPQSSSMYQS
jgi:hypothetical protein